FTYDAVCEKSGGSHGRHDTPNRSTRSPARGGHAGGGAVLRHARRSAGARRRRAGDAVPRRARPAPRRRERRSARPHARGGRAAAGAGRRGARVRRLERVPLARQVVLAAHRRSRRGREPRHLRLVAAVHLRHLRRPVARRRVRRRATRLRSPVEPVLHPRHQGRDPRAAPRPVARPGVAQDEVERAPGALLRPDQRRKMKALVTGAAGFIGSNVVRALLGAGHAVRALHLPGEDVRNLAGLDVERVAGDVTDGPAMRRAAAGCDRVFHLAAIYALWTRDPERMRRVNVDGTRTVLEAARAAGVERVVYTSSIARFGGQGRGRRATEESPFALGPTGDGYSRSKFEAHEVARAFAGDVDVVIVAPTGPIGPGDVGPTPTGRLLLRALTMPVVVVPDSATNFADVRDMARGHLLAA